MGIFKRDKKKQEKISLPKGFVDVGDNSFRFETTGHKIRLAKCKSGRDIAHIYNASGLYVMQCKGLGEAYAYVSGLPTDT